MTQSLQDDYSRQKEHSPSAYIFAIVISVLLIIIFSIPLLNKRNYNKIQLNGSINLNRASAGSIARLPGIGMSKAQSIIGYRQEFLTKNGEKAFKDSNDLRKIKGFGDKTIEKLEQWIEF